MRTTAIPIGCLGIFVLMTACSHKQETFSGNNVSGGELRSPLQKVFAHIDEEHYLTVNGKTYQDIVGSAPYYLEVPGLNSVLFVTGDENKGNVQFHIVSRETGHETVINGGQIHFGSNIGAPRKPGEAYTDFVLKADSDEVTLVNQGTKARVIIILNLISNKVENVQREVVNEQ